MAQKIAVQDGKVLYVSSDPTTIGMDFTVDGLIRAGRSLSEPGVITTLQNSGVDLFLTTNTNGVTNGNIVVQPKGNIRLVPQNGRIVLGQVVWPDGTVQAVPGMYLGVSAVNTLQFFPLPGGGGGGGGAEPLNQVVYGTGAGVTSSPNLKFDSAADTLSVGGESPGSIQSKPGQPISVESDVSLSLVVNSIPALGINSTGAFSVNGSPGTAGQILTSGGSSAPPVWADSSGGAVAPLNNVVYGTGTGITSDPNFQYDPTASRLAIGGSGTAIIQSLTSEPLFVISDTLITLAINSGDGFGQIQIFPSGAVSFAGSSGLAGQVLTSGGSSAPPTWSDSGGGGGGSQPLNQIVYGTGGGVTSDASLTYDFSQDMLSVGGERPGSIQSKPGQPISVESDVSISLMVNGINGMTIDTLGVVSFNGLTGSPGQVLTSSGLTDPPTWQDPGGGGGGVSQIIAGTNVTISPVGGTGVVTINAAAGGGGTPGGPSSAIQFNNAGAFAGSANFTYVDSDPLFLSSQITFNNTSGNRIVGADGSSGRSLQITGGNGTSGTGGSIAIAGGNGTSGGLGGTVTLTGGRTDTTGQPGADVILVGGGANNSGGNGGNIVLQAGTTLNASNGAVKIQTGNPKVERLWIDGVGAWLLAGTTSGTNGQVLTSAGAAGPPTWQTPSTGSVTMPLGTSALPGWAFTGDSNTGFFSPGADRLGVSTNGLQRMQIDASGNVSIGAVSPVGQLTVTGDGQVSNNPPDAGAKGGSIWLAENLIGVGSGGTIYFALGSGRTVPFSFIKGFVTSGTNNTSGDLVFGTRSVNTDTSMTEKLRILADGTTLIGATAPTSYLVGTTPTISKLQVAADINPNANPSISVARFNNGFPGPSFIFGKSRGTTVGTQGILLQNDVMGSLVWNGSDGTQMREGAKIAALVDGTPATITVPGALVFYTTLAGSGSSTERMRINNAGNVTIATPSTGDSLVLNGSLTSNSQIYASIGSAGLPGYAFVGDTDTGIYSPGAEQIAFVANGRNRLQYTAAGTWLISNTQVEPPSLIVNSSISSGAAIDIACIASTSEIGTLKFQNAAGTLTQLQIQATNAGSYMGTAIPQDLTIYTDSNNRIVITKTGNVNIGLPTSGGHSIAGVVSITSLTGSGSRAVLADATGALSAPTSDVSVKENIEVLDYGIDTIKALKPVSFEWNKNNKNRGVGRQVGFIAQDVEQVIPELVGTTYMDDMKYINYPEMTAILTSAMQQQQSIIEKLQARIDKLEAMQNK